MVYNRINREQIVNLAKVPGKFSISIYLPTFRVGLDAKQGRIKLKNLLIEAEERLVKQGMRHTIAIDMLRPAHELGNDEEFWNVRLDSVAIFISKGIFEAFHLPFSVDEFVHVGPRFHIRPLLRVLTSSEGHYVLALEKGHVRLVECDPFGANEVAVEDMPHAIDEFSHHDRSDKHLQFHSGGRAGRAGAVIGHSTYDKDTEAKETLHRFSIAISHAVERRLQASTRPVVLAGTKEFQDSFRSVSNLKLLETGILQSPKVLDAEDLRIRSIPIVEDHMDSDRISALARYRELAGTGLSSSQLDHILLAADTGRVDILFADEESMIWGTFDAGSKQIVMHRELVEGDGDLINEAAVASIVNKGTVYGVTQAELDVAGPVAAIFRY